jgi:uncharacterized membrane protein YcaP (DUF421 family)
MAPDINFVVRTVLVLLALLLVARILGRRTLSELTFYDFVVGLVVGNIGSAVITDEKFGLYRGVVVLITATLWILVINFLSLKSLPARKLLEAEPLLVINDGAILEHNLKKRYYNVNDLLEMLREQGTFDPGEVAVALIEADGQLSVLKKPQYQTLTGKDLGITAQSQTPAAALAGKEVIIDGKIVDQGLAQSGLSLESLQGQLAALGITDVAEVMLAMITPEGKLYVDRRKGGRD